jgi:hypothetical protein
MTNLITPHHSKKMGCEYGVDQTEQQIEREVSSVISKQRIASPSSSLPSSSPSSTLASNIRAKNTSGSARARPPVNKAGDELCDDNDSDESDGDSDESGNDSDEEDNSSARLTQNIKVRLDKEIALIKRAAIDNANTPAIRKRAEENLLHIINAVHTKQKKSQEQMKSQEKDDREYTVTCGQAINQTHKASAWQR